MSTSLSGEIIALDPDGLVGKGLHRECFVHPEDPSRCIKIVVAGTGDENRREQACYASLARRAVSWEMLPRFHGMVLTSLGEGAVFDLVRDHDNRISMSLEHYLASRQLSRLHGAELRRALDSLRAYLLDNRIITMTLKPKNILFQLETIKSGKLVIVDNIGNSDFIPLANVSALFAHRKIERKWRRFEQSLLRDYPGSAALRRR